MVISNNLLNELINLEKSISILIENENASNMQIEEFLRNLEKRRYNILTQIKLHNKTTEYTTERIRNINDNYTAVTDGHILKLYVPEPMPSYKNLKTHAFKNILLNLAEITKPYINMFHNRVFIFIKIYDNIKGWDIDNKFIKPISDALILSGVIKDDNIDNMFYCVKGEYSENPHTEIYVANEEKMLDIFEKYNS